MNTRNAPEGVQRQLFDDEPRFHVFQNGVEKPVTSANVRYGAPTRLDLSWTDGVVSLSARFVILTALYRGWTFSTMHHLRGYTGPQTIELVYI